MSIYWSGPTGGLGNRMLGLASASAVAGLLEKEIFFSWRNTPRCPCEYNELFSSISGLRIGHPPKLGQRIVQTDGWNPVRVVNDFEKSLRVEIDRETFWYRMVHTLRTLEYSHSVTSKLAKFHKLSSGTDSLAIHVRRTDRLIHHGRLYRHKLSAYRIARNTGLKKSLQYLLFPTPFVCRLENRTLLTLLKNFLSKYPTATYSLYCDSREEHDRVRQYFKDGGIPVMKYRAGYCGLPESGAWGTYGIRNTRVRDALVELLEMSRNHYIVQNNPASTFSLVAAIIGSVPIISRKPTHEFWQAIAEKLGAEPNSSTI